MNKIINIVLALAVVSILILGLNERQKLNELNLQVDEQQQKLVQINSETEEETTRIEELKVEAEELRLSKQSVAEVYEKWKKYNQKLIDLLP